MIRKQIDRFLIFWNSPYGPICTISILLAVLGTFAINVTFPIFGLVLIAGAPWLIEKIHEMELPGGFKTKMNELEQYTEKAKKAGLYTDNSATASLPYQLIYEQDPNLAMAGLRIEIEKRLRELANIAGFDLVSGAGILRNTSLRKLGEELRRYGHLSQEEYALLSDLLPTLNRAVHGEKVDKEASDWVVNDGSKILAGLDYKITLAKQK